MKTIKFELPYKNMDYLASLTEAISEHPEVILVTAFRDENDVIRDCTISIKENSNTDDILFQLGVTVGMHASNYTQRMIEEQERFFKAMTNIGELILQSLDSETSISSQNKREITLCDEPKEEEQEETKEEEQEETDLQSKHEESINRLAKILGNFKKRSI